MNCKLCNINFTPKYHTQKFCSEQCRKKQSINLMKIRRSSETYRIKQNIWNNKWRVKNMDSVRLSKRKSQEKIHNTLRVVGYVTSEIRSIIYKKYNDMCTSCGSTENKTVDHIIPISRGGLTVIENLQLLCRSCNSKKSNK